MRSLSIHVALSSSLLFPACARGYNDISDHPGADPNDLPGLAGADPLADAPPVVEIGSGYQFTEGTCWFASEGILRFTDIPASRIHQRDPQGTIALFREPSGQTNGIAVTPEGALVACEGENRQLTLSTAGGPPEIIAASHGGARFNSPNDVIVRGDGTLYFTDPTYGLDLHGGQQEMAFQGVYRVTPAREVHLVSDAFAQPNGIALSPDERTLYVTDTEEDALYTFALHPDGSTGPREKLCDTLPSPDGMAVDDAGNLYLTTEPGVQVLRPDGTELGLIPVPQVSTNCAFGGADRRTLYISAQTSLYEVPLSIPGKP
ncbi:SMP-30/gluconolactonase/LRE family protein [Chondromyces apiculatus]|uniref:Gluconolactonase n=1 Tax=Chondromyces apiculatus DSM 436 TaxID=1192034 RepID=A0A017TA27_9BACT|nr:SMP-30/gluconolactonase/LRE family protein [Chondromyces apiculatus]EYF06123.1 Gluconolactonase [Chondromyces apiculatus DSM 436]